MTRGWRTAQYSLFSTQRTESFLYSHSKSFSELLSSLRMAPKGTRTLDTIYGPRIVESFLFHLFRRRENLPFLFVPSEDHLFTSTINKLPWTPFTILFTYCTIVHRQRSSWVPYPEFFRRTYFSANSVSILTVIFNRSPSPFSSRTLLYPFRTRFRGSTLPLTLTTRQVLLRPLHRPRRGRSKTPDNP